MDSWHFFLIAILVDAILIPIAWRLVDTLNELKADSKETTKALSTLCSNISSLAQQTSETIIRDVELKKDLEAIRQELRDHIAEERAKDD